LQLLNSQSDLLEKRNCGKIDLIFTWVVLQTHVKPFVALLHNNESNLQNFFRVALQKKKERKEIRLEVSVKIFSAVSKILFALLPCLRKS